MRPEGGGTTQNAARQSEFFKLKPKPKPKHGPKDKANLATWLRIGVVADLFKPVVLSFRVLSD